MQQLFNKKVFVSKNNKRIVWNHPIAIRYNKKQSMRIDKKVKSIFLNLFLKYIWLDFIDVFIEYRFLFKN